MSVGTFVMVLEWEREAAEPSKRPSCWNLSTIRGWGLGLGWASAPSCSFFGFGNVRHIADQEKKFSGLLSPYKFLCHPILFIVTHAPPQSRILLLYVTIHQGMAHSEGVLQGFQIGALFEMGSWDANFGN